MFGRRKLTPEAYAAQLARKARTQTKTGVRFGKRKGNPAAPESAPQGEATAAPPTVNPFLVEAPDLSTKRLPVKSVEKALKDQPGLLDAAIAAEFRADLGAPRASLLDVLLKLEEAAESPRTRVLALLRLAKGRSAEGE